MLGKDNRGSKDNNTQKGYKLIKLWTIILILIVSIIGGQVAWIAYGSKEAAIKLQTERMSPNMTEEGFTPGTFTLPANATPTKVTSGIYVDRITDFSVRDCSWNVDFYIWFKWRGNIVNPGETFQIVEGQILSKNLESSYDNGDEHYRLYMVSAKITQFFDVRRFPLDDHVITIRIEDREHKRQDLIYVAENNTSSVSSRVKIPGYQIGQISVIEKAHDYRTSLGDPRLALQEPDTHSQLLAGIWISRPDPGYFFRLFMGLFIAVATALTALFIKPSGQRIGLGTGALFIAIANMLINSNLVPNIEIMTLADRVSYTGLVFILLTIIESTITLYLYDIKGNEELSGILDKISFIILIIFYIAINVAIIALAKR